MRVFIFSYNRGAFLENAVASVERHLPGARLTVMDDRSDDPATQAALDRLAARLDVQVAPEPADACALTGGLHAGMNRALDRAEAEGETLALMLQDDMQIVRDVTDDDLRVASQFFERPDASFVLAANFAKSRRGAQDIGLWRDGDVYLRDTADAQDGRHCAYSDTGLFHIPRLRATLERLLTGEKANEAAVRALGLQLGFMVMPFEHYLPFPLTYRARGRDWRVRLLDALSGAGVHPIAPLEGKRLEAFLSRDPESPAFAEDWLEVPTAPPARYWSLRGGVHNALARGGWRGSLARWLR